MIDGDEGGSGRAGAHDGEGSAATAEEPGGPTGDEPDNATAAAPGDGGTRRPRVEPDDATGVHPAAAEREFGWRGSLLLGVMLLALVVAPVVVYLRPPALPWRVTLIVFPLLPAMAMGAVAVWATTRP